MAFGIADAAGTRQARLRLIDIDGYEPNDAVSALRQEGVVATVAPYAEPHVRLTPSIRSNEQEIECALEAVRSLAG